LGFKTAAIKYLQTDEYNSATPFVLKLVKASIRHRYIQVSAGLLAEGPSNLKVFKKLKAIRRSPIFRSVLLISYLNCIHHYLQFPVSLHGSLILQEMLRFSKPIKVCVIHF
jgi:hypothetical protein